MQCHSAAFILCDESLHAIHFIGSELNIHLYYQHIIPVAVHIIIYHFEPKQDVVGMKNVRKLLETH